MKKTYLILPIVLFMLTTSCSDEFNINAPHEDIYILNCILRTDTNIQYAILSKNRYTENGTAPDSINADQYVRGAIIKLLYKDSVFVMRDTTIEISDSGEKTIVYCYYTSAAHIGNNDVKIEAALPNGKILKSAIQAPLLNFLSYKYYFPCHYQSGYFAQQEYQWMWILDNQRMDNILNLPQLVIYYKKYENGEYIDKEIAVPLAYDYGMYAFGIFRNEVYPAYKSFCGTSLNTMNHTMQEISGDDPYKQNYIINKVILKIIGLEENLARYYYAGNTFEGSFTIKLRPTEVSNIDGGIGIFGGYYSYSKPFEIDSIYVNSFGYRYDPLP